jgi:hypothetical protein
VHLIQRSGELERGAVMIRIEGQHLAELHCCRLRVMPGVEGVEPRFHCAILALRAGSLGAAQRHNHCQGYDEEPRSASMMPHQYPPQCCRYQTAAKSLLGCSDGGGKKSSDGDTVLVRLWVQRPAVLLIAAVFACGEGAVL